METLWETARLDKTQILKSVLITHDVKSIKISNR